MMMSGKICPHCNAPGDADFTSSIPVDIPRLNLDDSMAKIGDISPLRPVWPKKPQDKLDPNKNMPRRKRTPSSGEDDSDSSEPDSDEGHIDDYA